MSTFSAEQGMDSYLKKHGWIGSKKSVKVPIFGLPIELIPSLNDCSQQPSDSTTDTQVSKVSNDSSKGLTCITCGLTFVDYKDQQKHFKSDLHLVNLKRRVKNMGSLTCLPSTQGADDESEQKASDGQQDTADDDASSSEESEAENEKVDEALLRPTSYTDERGSILKQYSAQRGPTFHIRDAQFLKWEMVLSAGVFGKDSAFLGREWNTPAEERQRENRDSATNASPWMQLGAYVSHLRRNPICGVFLLRSGRFAGAFFDGTTLLIHKVMRRYTVRAKAGGGQSSHDNKSGKAKSAGAMLRRYGEQALKEDIAACMILWSGHIQSCSLIFISAPKTMRSILFDDNTTATSSSNSGITGVVLSKDDPRISYVPFMVDRPTLEEAEMVHDRCTSVYFNRMDDADGASTAQSVDAEALSIIPAAGLPGILKPSKSSEEATNTAATAPGLLQCPASQRLIAACQGADEDAALAVLEEMAEQPAFEVFSPRANVITSSDTNTSTTPTTTAGAEGSVSDTMELSLVLNLVESLETLSTALHVASAQGRELVVTRLLELGASPLSTDIRGRMPYYIAKDKETRDAFRRYRGTPEGEERWDWNAAGVGAALSEEAEKQQKLREKEKEKEKKKRAAQRKKEAKLKEDEEAAQAERQLVEQQQRAKHQAEYAKISAGACASCNVSLYGKLALDIYDKRCCSAECVVKLRRTLAADAAMKRFQTSS